MHSCRFPDSYQLIVSWAIPEIQSDKECFIKNSDRQRQFDSDCKSYAPDRHTYQQAKEHDRLNLEISGFISRFWYGRC